MKKKDVGAALRRGVVAGTIAGALAGWTSFAVRAAALDGEISFPGAPAALPPALPALPAHPSLAPLPNVRTVQAPSTVVLPPVRTTTTTPVTRTAPS